MGEIQSINDVMNVTLLGDLIGIVGNSGTGKSTLCMDFANCLCRERGNYSAFFSLEMASHACFFVEQLYHIHQMNLVRYHLRK